MLDNCEHLLRRGRRPRRTMVRGCPAVRVLATSREGLNVAGERMLGVASLDVPDDGAATRGDRGNATRWSCSWSGPAR